MDATDALLNEIRDQLNGLLVLVEAQRKDINKIQRWITAQEKKSKPIPCSAVITSPAETYEYGEVTIQIDEATWTKIKKGEVFTIQGQGWRFEGFDDDELTQDHWTFNEGKQGAVCVKLEDEDEPRWWGTAYSGCLSDCEIQEIPVKPKKHRAGW